MKPKHQKSNVLWMEYDIDWFKMAKSSCDKCWGRGYEGYEVRTPEQELRNEERVKILCECVANKWSKMTDEERMKYAIRKPDADELVAKARAEVAKLIDEVKEKEAVNNN